MTMRDTVARFVLNSGSLVRVFKRIPGIRACAKKVAMGVLPVGYRDWFQVQGGVGKGIWLKLNPRTGDAYYRGQAEAQLQQLLQGHLRPSMVFYDLGANNGFFSLLAARLVGQTGKVVAFEAEPRIANDLEENVAKNHACNIRVVRSAVWSSSGAVNFDPADRRMSPDLGTGKVVSRSNERTVGLPAICLDDFVETERPPHFVKCDTEGAEVEVFRGATKLLAKFRPYFECEVHSQENRLFLQDAFEQMNYDVRWCSANHFLAVPRESHSNLNGRVA